MGLPLFIAPVESDIPSKPAAKSPADIAHSRSPIRRVGNRRRELNDIREHRLGLLAALQSNESNSNLPQNRPAERLSPDEPTVNLVSLPPFFDEPSFEELAGLIPRNRSESRGPRSNVEIEIPGIEIDGPGNRSESHGPRSNANIEIRPVRVEVPDTTPLHEESYMRNDRVSWNDSSRPDQWSLGARSSTRVPRMRSSREVINGPPFGSSRRYVLPRGYESRTPGRSYDSSDYLSYRSATPQGPDPAEYLTEYRRRRGLRVSSNQARIHRHVRLVRYADGLGDRDRSLSPEGDREWDTLQSTLTPDPQPPSVGSSFASTSASAAASQTTANSSNTSMTNPEEEAEPPCDPAVDNSDTDGERDEDAEEQQTEPPRRPTLQWRRSYADVVAELLPASRDDGPERLEWLSDMQNIIRRLAEQERIPDEWWAGAGLSRSAAWDESN
ncbi:uncharacterized protein BCR38DRAFT_472312 [Pseudomassariella vexata]|uniref:Uncharacterized protein n=1 Tax=Pseudomassariella vexata TaxID=1141098 RepID=A0A1Y2EBC7_9PEZI|nr:uncharacterized protein BCR38DRAFT_472312 [Pseudomassariella vexata]ORY68861.1 hypothetical protein BCR38DRAFT_472312 [Pseudomassariella vexata]